MSKYSHQLIFLFILLRRSYFSLFVFGSCRLERNWIIDLSKRESFKISGDIFLPNQSPITILLDPTIDSIVFLGDQCRHDSVSISIYTRRVKRNGDDNIRLFPILSRSVSSLGHFLFLLFGKSNFCVHLFLYHASNVDYFDRRLISNCPHVFTSRRQLNTQSSIEEDRRSIITMIFWFRKLFEFVFHSVAFDRLEHKRKGENERERNRRTRFAN